VLLRIGDADPDHGLLDECRLRQLNTAGAEVLGHMERERVTTGVESCSGEQRRCHAPVVRGDCRGKRQRHPQAAILVQIDAHTGRGHTRCNIENVRCQLPHCSRC
jgi:hypothetical protein